MRYLGNKEKLLPVLEDELRGRGVVPPGLAIDAFCGAGSVSRLLKILGWNVLANDLLACATTQAHVGVGIETQPSFEKVLALPELKFFFEDKAESGFAMLKEPGGSEPYRKIFAFLNEKEHEAEGVMARHFSKGVGRGYFLDSVARRIDGCMKLLKLWDAQGALSRDERSFLLASILDAADRCANISGTYASFLKRTSAHRTFRLKAPDMILGSGSSVARSDANVLVQVMEAKLIYIDPPYNERQYAKNFHVMEILAELVDVRDEDLAAYEAGIRGVTGLRDFDSAKSRYCSERSHGNKHPASEALDDLVKDAACEHIVMSYGEEGIMGRARIVKIFKDRCNGFDESKDFVELRHKRFRSDGFATALRKYKPRVGREVDESREWLIFGRK